MRSFFADFLAILLVLFLCVARAAAMPGLLPYGSKGEEVQIGSSAAPQKRDTLFPAKTSQPKARMPRTRERTEPTSQGPSLLAEPRAQTAGDKILLFGTVEFKRPLSSLPAWMRLLERNKAASIFVKGKVLRNSTLWEQFQREAQAKKGLDQVRYVHAFWNAFPYREDIVNWKVQDYWAIPSEFLQKSGDCEDYAIVKYFTLKELGVPPESMRIVVLRDTVRNLAHAVLVVYMNNDAYVLDNLSTAVLSHRHFTHYLPQYSINEFSRWAHLKGRPAKSSAKAGAR